MRDHKWKDNTARMQQMVNLHGVSTAAKIFDTDEIVFRKACHNYGIKLPDVEPRLSENHPKVIKWIKRRNEIMLSMPFGNV